MTIDTNRLRELLPSALGQVESSMDMGWKQLDHAWQVLNAFEGICAALEAERTARLAETEAELQIMRTAGIIEVAVRNPSVMEYIKHWEGRAEAAEAALATKDAEIARLRDALEFYADKGFDGYDIDVTNYGLSMDLGCIIKDGGERARAALEDTP